MSGQSAGFVERGCRTDFRNESLNDSVHRLVNNQVALGGAFISSLKQ